MLDVVFNELDPSLPRLFFNSGLIAVVVTVSNVVLGSIAGYAFARLRFLHFLSRLRRNTTHQVRDVTAALNAAFLDWSFSEKVVPAFR